MRLPVFSLVVHARRAQSCLHCTAVQAADLSLHQLVELFNERLDALYVSRELFPHNPELANFVASVEIV